MATTESLEEAIVPKSDARRSPTEKGDPGKTGAPSNAGGEEEESRIDDCILLGPPGSGKTSFLAALGRAGLLSQRDELRCQPLGQAVWLLKDTSWALSRNGALASPSTCAGSYSFAVERRRGHRREVGPTTAGTVIFHDLYRRLFPSRADGEETEAAEASLSGNAVEQARTARYMILCIDPFYPRPDDWQTVLPTLVDNLSTAQQVASARDGQSVGCTNSAGRLRNSHKGLKRPVRRRALPFDRVLVLFSRVDLLCEQVLQAMMQGRLQASEDGAGSIGKSLGRTLSQLCPAALLRRMDLTAEAVSLVGDATISILLGAIRTGAELGIGFCSAGGFDTHRDGRPFLGPDGRAADHQSVESQDVLRGWHPFGVLEALEFLMWGHTAATVQAVDRSALLEQRGVHWL